MRHERHIAGALLAFALFACGADSSDSDERAFQDEARCLSCDAAPTLEPIEPSQAAPKVTANPLELMFYPWSVDSPEFDPKPVVVANLTSGFVAITRVDIYDDPKGLVGAHDYFAVDPLTEKVLLDKGEQTTLWVSYLGSVEQVSAYLVINTTDPTYHTLTVSLAGKFFFDSTGD